MSPTISYAVTASTEEEELPLLLDLLQKYKGREDEIVLQFDEGTAPVIFINETAKKFKDIKIITHPLDNHFGDFKNNLKKHCLKDYIFQIDADELPNKDLLKALPDILEANPDTGLFHLPRINTVNAITDEHIRKWKWNLNEKGWIQWPDWQPRLFKNLPHIKWELAVHETVVNYGIGSFFPESEEFCLYHPKTIQKQERQNAFYETFHTDS
jgi:hypothetical protein|tara:strand:- start:2390 stop:3025 length:636 start_codon:yes stop_codon:yes gene_type:complete